LYAFSVHNFSVGVLGGSGYAGRELCALIERHPALSLSFATAQSQRGESIRVGGRSVTFVAPGDADLASASLVFSALPHGHSLPWVERARSAGAKVVDLSSDLRPGRGPLAGTAAGDVPYGLPEFHRDAIAGASVVANPGCYATAVLLALVPLASRGLIAPGATVSVSAASGVTGAGHTPRPDLLFAEVESDFRAYAVGNCHRHLPEMRATLAFAGADCDLLFTPHLLPVARGILATITVPLTAPLADPVALFADAYAGEPFVEVADTPPSLREVTRRNVARLFATAVEGMRQPTLLVQAAIDNLVKGAAGQAVQNANLMLGLDEAMGLPT
jgi:N-acetyl-gamma-glutamyl-phosphate reductase